MAEIPKIEHIEHLEEESKRHKEEIGKLTQLLFVVVIVLLVGVGTMIATVGSLVWNAHMHEQGTYQKLIDELEKQNDKLDILLQKNQ